MEEVESVTDVSDIKEALRLYNELSDRKKKQFILVLLNLEDTVEN